ncbi:MAG: rRNA maturation RNase YbeY [Pseudomonadota bacterium]
MSVTVDLRIDDKSWERISDLKAVCESAIQHAANHVEPNSSIAVDVLLSNDDQLAELNKAWRGKAGPTDVLSFPADPLERPFIGDIAVTIGVAERDAAQFGKPLDAHLIHLLVHGVLHLLGYDHGTDTQAAIMENLERDILSDLGYGDPYSRIEQS